jgi:hypothetical protein
MAKTLELYRERLRALIELALNEGWIVCADADGPKLVKPGRPPILIGAVRRAGTPEDQGDSEDSRDSEDQEDSRDSGERHDCRSHA